MASPILQCLPTARVSMSAITEWMKKTRYGDMLIVVKKHTKISGTWLTEIDTGRRSAMAFAAVRRSWIRTWQEVMSGPTRDRYIQFSEIRDTSKGTVRFVYSLIDAIVWFSSAYQKIAMGSTIIMKRWCQARWRLTSEDGDDDGGKRTETAFKSFLKKKRYWFLFAFFTPVKLSRFKLQLS